MNHPTTAARDLYETILRDPSCDLVRLAYADEIDGAGEGERANWIREQIANPKRITTACYGDREVGQACPWDDGKKFCPGCSDMLDEGFPASLLGEDTVYWRRGFVDEVAMSLRAFMGGECGECSWAEFHRDRVPFSSPITCPHCKCTGRTPGLASVICAKWPVREIRLVDREPWDIVARQPYNWRWFDESRPNRSGDHPASDLPHELFIRLSGPGKRKATCDYIEREAAMLAPSHAAVAYARELAGLPALKWMTNANNPLLDGPADRPVHAGNRPNDRLSGPRLSQ